jgi:SAM-dependent MidA family methyltransferase
MIIEHPIHQACRQAGGWLAFDAFMNAALYDPQIGYYRSDRPQFGLMPQPGSDFVTAPQLSPLFGQALAVQVRQALVQSGCCTVWEFGAGTGELALQLLDSLGDAVVSYQIVELSGQLQARQRATLQAWNGKVQWLSALPLQMHGVVIGNEVLDAMPVQLLVRKHGVWHERGVVSAGQGFDWSDRPTSLRPPIEIAGSHDYLTEIHPQAHAFARTLADRLQTGLVLLLDYGFPEAEYYHPQRHMGTLMCHQAHRSDPDPLTDPGAKDITTHVNFTGVALAAQEAGLEVLGYTSQGRFLLNCGLADEMQVADLPTRAQAAKLVMEHEMGELFKVLALGAGDPWQPLGFAAGDRTHTL